MRILCPLCGERDVSEFHYLGDALLVRRPDPNAPEAAQQFYTYVYLRDNPAGWHDEQWFHEAGCRSWLCVTRNTLTHVIKSVVRSADSRDEAPSL